MQPVKIDAYVPIGTKGILEFASIHVYKTRPERIINDLQTFSNIEEDNLPCAIAVLDIPGLSEISLCLPGFAI